MVIVERAKVTLTAGGATNAQTGASAAVIGRCRLNDSEDGEPRGRHALDHEPPVFRSPVRPGEAVVSVSGGRDAHGLERLTDRGKELA